MVTPVPKCFPPKSPEELRNISGLLTFDKVSEQLVAELIISDMANLLDKSQYANQKDLSLQHYLVKMINKILFDTDNNSQGEVNAVLATLYDWKEAFPRQCPHAWCGGLHEMWSQAFTYPPHYKLSSR